MIWSCLSKPENLRAAQYAQISASCTSQRPDPRGFDHGPGLAIGSGQEVVQWPTVTLARKRQNCGYDQGTGSGVFQGGQRGARLNERQPAVPVLGGLLAYPFKAADPRGTPRSSSLGRLSAV